MFSSSNRQHQKAITVRFHASLSEIDASQWERLTEPLPTSILDYHWLHALESSGSITPATGWQPNHLTLWEGTRLIGAAPLYIKFHSDGEFVFDHWLAQIAAEENIPYYPKLVGMSPATPAVGYRFLIAPDRDAQQIAATMFALIDQFCQVNHLSGCHFLFVDSDWFSRFAPPVYSAWHHQSYLWQNRGYTTFSDYLSCFRAGPRRNIRREQESMNAQGITIRPLTGDQLTEELAALMHSYYLKTNDRYGHWAARFLYGDFFQRIFSTMSRNLLLMAAYSSETRPPIALSLLLKKHSHLIGRYWGCVHPQKDLHFNMCYYAPLSWAIENSIRTVDPGAGSPHKIARGFTAVGNHSLHRFYDQRLADLFPLLMQRANQMTADQINTLNTKLPFKERTSEPRFP